MVCLAKPFMRSLSNLPFAILLSQVQSPRLLRRRLGQAQLGRSWRSQKLFFAAAIDQMHELRGALSSGPGQARHASIAITQIEDAQMRAVKAITWKE